MSRSKEKMLGGGEGGERHFISGEGKKSILYLEGSQAIPARPSAKDRIRVKTLG
jgi:hypothetical protein